MAKTLLFILYLLIHGFCLPPLDLPVRIPISLPEPVSIESNIKITNHFLYSWKENLTFFAPSFEWLTQNQTNSKNTVTFKGALSLSASTDFILLAVFTDKSALYTLSHDNVFWKNKDLWSFDLLLDQESDFLNLAVKRTKYYDLEALVINTTHQKVVKYSFVDPKYPTSSSSSKYENGKNVTRKHEALVIVLRDVSRNIGSLESLNLYYEDLAEVFGESNVIQDEHMELFFIENVITNRIFLVIGAKTEFFLFGTQPFEVIFSFLGKTETKEAIARIFVIDSAYFTQTKSNRLVCWGLGASESVSDPLYQKEEEVKLIPESNLLWSFDLSFLSFYELDVVELGDGVWIIAYLDRNHSSFRLFHSEALSNSILKEPFSRHFSFPIEIGEWKNSSESYRFVSFENESLGVSNSYIFAFGGLSADETSGENETKSAFFIPICPPMFYLPPGSTQCQRALVGYGTFALGVQTTENLPCTSFIPKNDYESQIYSFYCKANPFTVGENFTESCQFLFEGTSGSWGSIPESEWKSIYDDVRANFFTICERDCQKNGLIEAKNECFKNDAQAILAVSPCSQFPDCYSCSMAIECFWTEKGNCLDIHEALSSQSQNYFGNLSINSTQNDTVDWRSSFPTQFLITIENIEKATYEDQYTLKLQKAAKSCLLPENSVCKVDNHFFIVKGAGWNSSEPNLIKKNTMCSFSSEDIVKYFSTKYNDSSMSYLWYELEISGFRNYSSGNNHSQYQPSLTFAFCTPNNTRECNYVLLEYGEHFNEQLIFSFTDFQIFIVFNEDAFVIGDMVLTLNLLFLGEFLTFMISLIKFIFFFSLVAMCLWMCTEPLKMVSVLIRRRVRVPFMELQPEELPGNELFDFLKEKKHLRIWKFNARKVDFGQDKCCFCLDQFSEGVEIVEAACKHIYHSDCVKSWFQSDANGITCCPVCSKPFKDKRKAIQRGERRGRPESEVELAEPQNYSVADL